MSFQSPCIIGKITWNVFMIRQNYILKKSSSIVLKYFVNVEPSHVREAGPVPVEAVVVPDQIRFDSQNVVAV